MSSYLDHKGYGPWTPHTWMVDLRQRLRFLYGDPDARIQANRPDLQAWRNLGQRDAA